MNLTTCVCRIALTMTIINIVAAMPTSSLDDQTNSTGLLSNSSSTMNSTDYSAIMSRLFNTTGISNEEALELLVQAYSNGRISTLNTTVLSGMAPVGGIQPALLDYENETEIEELEKVVANETEPLSELILPADVYEVPLEVWIAEEDDREEITEEEDELEEPLPYDDVQMLISEALKPPSSTSTTTPTPPHLIRHHSRRSLANNPRRNRVRDLVSDPDILSRPDQQPSNSQQEGNIMDLLQTNRNREREDNTRPMELIRTRDRFNMTVDFQAPFHNIESDKLLEIVLLMNSDCTRLPQKMVRWVSGSRGILFECKNGAWVVTYLSRRKKKVRLQLISDCHELHLQGVELSNPQVEHRLELTYDDGSQKKREVICRHDDRHTNHQLIDNHINADPDEPVRTVPQTISGAWTVIQRRANGETKFYRSLKRYKTGFGSIESGEYWLGLKLIHEMTHTRPYMIRVEVTASNNITYYSEYESFRVGSEAKSFRLRLGNYIEPENSSLSAGDFLTLHHGGKFHTRDSEAFGVNCAKLYGTAFWFRGCWAAVNLNGPYITDDANNIGVRWATANPNEVRRVWKTEMMIKPIL